MDAAEELTTRRVLAAIEAERARQELCALAGKDVNPGSPLQMQKLLGIATITDVLDAEVRDAMTAAPPRVRESLNVVVVALIT